MKSLKQLINEIWPHHYSIEKGDLSQDDVGHPDIEVGEPLKKLHDTLHATMPLDFDHTETITSYTENSARYNGRLYKEHIGQPPGPWERAPNHENIVHSMDELTNLHRTPHDMHVYTGVKFNPHRFKEAGKSRIEVHLPAYTSTSIHPHVATSFADGADLTDDESAHHYNNIVKLHVPQGTRGVYFGHHSSFPSEKEFVLPRHTKIHIHPEPEIVTDPRHEQSGMKYAVWHARVVHDGTEATRHMEEDHEKV